jgi:hypothetical protein
MNLIGLPWNALNPLEPQYWLPPRDSNPDMLLQRQLSYH